MKSIQVNPARLFLSIYCMLILSACSVNDYKEAEKTVKNFYTQYKPGDYRTADKSLLSKDLLAKVEAASLKQSQDAERLKVMGSTDKPLMIEGDVYTSLYEGATQHEIIKTIGEESRAKVEVKFKNSFYNHSWSDTVLLIKEGERWKIDDVFYTKKQGGAVSTKALFSEFLLLK